MSTKNTIISMIILSLIGIGMFYVLNVNKVTQKVTENSAFDHPYEMYHMSEPVIFNYRNADGSIDSVQYKEMVEYNKYYNKIEEERKRMLTSPYKLVTRYKDHQVIDYGTASEIERIKCIRYYQVSINKQKYDRQDSLSEVEFDKFELAKELKQEELDRLNHKSCN